MKATATVLAIFLFGLIFLAPSAAEAELKLAILKVKGMTCPS
jgi:hypothetical protein